MVTTTSVAPTPFWFAFEATLHKTKHDASI